jgi:hypothetical protein
MRILLAVCALSPLSLSAQTTPQTTVSLQAATPIAAMTSASGGTTSFQGIPQGQPIGSAPQNVFLTTSQNVAGSYLSATTIIYPTTGYQGGAGFNFFERANARGAANEAAGTSASATQTGAVLGAHAVLAVFSAPPTTQGHIRVSFRNNAAVSGGTTGASVDVGNDGVFEVNQANPGEFSLPYTFGASGQVTVRVGNLCSSNGNGTSSMIYTWTELWVGFQPDLTATCTFTNYGQGCAGVQAAGNQLVVGNQRTIFMLATGCFPSSPTIVAHGSQQIALPLPAGCALLCNAEGLALALADAAGNATWSWTTPVTTLGTTHVQFLPIADQGGALVLRSSNGVRIDLVP